MPRVAVHVENKPLHVQDNPLAGVYAQAVK